MTTKTVTIPAINCGHCVLTVENEVSEINGVQSVSVDQDSKQAIIEWDDPATWDEIRALLIDIEYPAQEA
jgi:copper chaperone CopZ